MTSIDTRTAEMDEMTKALIYPLKGNDILRAFADQNRSGAQGCEMDCDGAKALAEAIDAAIAAQSAAPVGERDPLDDLVARFSNALLKKLKLARANGRSGWEQSDWEADCQRGLLRHVEKGDPRDVAAYCAFMWHHGWITAAPPPSTPMVREWKCLAVSKAACAWPDCGCDPEATKVIAAMVDQGWQPPPDWKQDQAEAP